MEVGIILKIVGVGLVVSVTNLILKQSGRDEYASLASLAGIIIVFMFIVGEIGNLYETVRGVFGV